MKAPYRVELEALSATYAAALAADVDDIRRAVTDLGAGPAAFVGSGGSMVLALLAARLHERVCRQPAGACTSLELLDLPQLQHRGAMLFSSSAKHPDAQRVLADFRRVRFSPAVVLTHRRADDLQAAAGPDTRIVTVDAPPQPDGFLATASILQIATLLLRSYLETPDLPDRLNPAPEDDVREEVLVLTPPSLTAAAVDIEVRLVESGLASVQVTDFRNFAHGRHTGFSRRAGQTTVIVLSDPASKVLGDATADLLPRDADVRRWHCDAPWAGTMVMLLARSMHLAGATGARAGVDVARPAVPAFGRRLYRLPLRGRVPELRAGGVERKLLASGAGDDAIARVAYERAGHVWTSDLAQQRFTGVILDYDGTVCWTRRRWQLPDPNVQAALLKLLHRGLVVGFASGRGRSLYADLRRWVPSELWPSVLIGLYNGAVRLRLDEQLSEIRDPTPWSQAVVGAIGDEHAGQQLHVEERGAQVSVSTAGGVMHHGQLARMLGQRLQHAGIGAQVVASGHSVDIVESTTQKTAVIDAVAEMTGGQVLAIGDQGQVGGNDHALLSATPWTLSVDRCSADPQSGWFAGSGEHVGPDLLVRYLRVLRHGRDGFAITKMVVS